MENVEDERFPVCVIDTRCVLLFGHEGGCVGRIDNDDKKEQSILETVAEIADFSNSVAELIVGHLRILVNGGISQDLAEVMCQALHARLLGLDIWDSNGVADFDGWPDVEELEDD